MVVIKLLQSSENTWITRVRLSQRKNSRIVGVYIILHMSPAQTYANTRDIGKINQLLSKDSSYPRLNVVFLGSCNQSMNLFFIFLGSSRRNSGKNISRRRGYYMQIAFVIFFRNPKRLYSNWWCAWLECDFSRSCKISTFQLQLLQYYRYTTFLTWLLN